MLRLATAALRFRAALPATLLCAALPAALLCAALPAAAADYTIMAPAAPGGGWDQTARAMQGALVADGIAGTVEVVNVPGAGGTVGLQQFYRQAKGDPDALIVGGSVMVGAIISNHSPIDLDMVTPIARLTGEAEAIVVPAASDIATMADLVTRMKADPQWVVWAGGSLGGPDQILAAEVAKAAEVDPTQIDYLAYAGGGEALAALLESGGRVTAGVSGLGEFADAIRAGQLRLLAVSGAARAAGFDAPTLREAGIDVTLENWRMVAAAPGLTAAQEQAIAADIARLAASEAWRSALAVHGWTDRYLAGPAFAAELRDEVARTRQILNELDLR